MDWIIYLIVTAAVPAWGIYTYNRLVRLRNRVDQAWADVDVQLQRRYDLVPNLLATVKGYTDHESGILERVTRLRSEAPASTAKRGEAESGLSRSIGRLFAVAEDYPELKASEGFQQLHNSLVEIEEHLQYARRYYNGSVRDNNNAVQGFPSMIVAKLFAFRLAEFFEIEFASQRQAPEIHLGDTP